MKEIPIDKQKFYSKEHQDLITSRIQLANALLKREVNIKDLSKLEVEILISGLQTAARKGVKVYVINNEKQYETLKKDPTCIYVLCDNEGNIKDIEPILDYVSPDIKKKYLQKRDQYLSSH